MNGTSMRVVSAVDQGRVGLVGLASAAGWSWNSVPPVLRCDWSPLVEMKRL